MPDVVVRFSVTDGDRFARDLQKAFEHDDNVFGLRSDVDPTLRAPLQLFAQAMEAKLVKNDHKQSWRELPVEALFKLLKIEISEFEVAMEYLSVKEARGELTDVANFALILWDRLSLEPQDTRVK